MEIRFENISANNYSQYYSQTQLLDVGPMLVPNTYNESLWGLLAFDENELVGGWVGKIRVKNKILKSLMQEVFFDSMPQVFNSMKISVQQIIDKAMQNAKKDAVTFLSVSHWSRSDEKFECNYFKPRENASFLVNLTKEDLLSTLSHAQRKKIKKAQRNEINFVVFNHEQALGKLEDFQNIRSVTQDRAIQRNKKTSMLLKSIDTYKKTLENYDSYLVATYYQESLAAMLLIVKSGKTIYPYYSGSDIEINRATGASSFLQWMLFQFAIEKGCKYVDMGGVPINPDESHPAYGIYVFKKDFGGEYHEYISGDFVLSPLKYKMIKMLQNSKFLIRFLSKKM